MKTRVSGTEQRSKFSFKTIKTKIAQKKEMTTDCCKNENVYVGFSDKARKKKMWDNEEIGRSIRSVYISRFFHLGSEKYHVLDR